MDVATTLLFRQPIPDDQQMSDEEQGDDEYGP